MVEMGSFDVAVIIPVYNEAEVIAQTIASVADVYPLVICVDDGSSDGSAGAISKTTALLVTHPINVGQGAALQTGIEFALRNMEAKHFVTFDADGQHDIRDVQHMLRTLRADDLDIVFGSRFLGSAPNMSRFHRLFLRIAVKFSNTLSRVRLTDTHNGLRVFNRAVAENLDITLPGMAHASEIIDTVKSKHWRYAEVPVTVSYTKYSRAKGQPTLNAINIVVDLFLSRSRR